MNSAHLQAPLTRPQTIWQWLCLLSLVCLGWVSREQLGAMFAGADDGALLVYDRHGNGVIYLPDDVAKRRPPPTAFSLSLSKGASDERDLLALDVALMKPSCCEAPAGLCHFWDRPKRIGGVLPTPPRHPGQGAFAADPGSPRGPIP